MPESVTRRSVLEQLRFLLPPRFRSAAPVVPVVRLSGVIGGAMPLRSGLTLAACAATLERAFSVRGAKAVALIISSPGGSPVQSHLIYKRVRSLAAEKKLPVLAFVEDAAASGGYMLACAGDEIIIDPSSIVGSIGVVSASFGFQELIARLGVERRVHTIGANKAMLDPFRPEDPQDVARLKAIQAQVQEMFVALVQSRRGTRLRGEPEALFSGAVFAGAEAVELGLADTLGDLRSVLRERYGEKTQLRLIGERRGSLLGRLIGRNNPLSETTSLIDPRAALAVLEERAAWARLGL
jgi:signal peptide peptidase SppA